MILWSFIGLNWVNFVFIIIFEIHRTSIVIISRIDPYPWQYMQSNIWTCQQSSLISTIVPDSLVIHYCNSFSTFVLFLSFYWSVQSLSSNRNELLICKLARFYSNVTFVFMHFSSDLARFRYLMLIYLWIINEGSKLILNVKLIHK